MKKNRGRLFAAALYILPAAFQVITYVFMTMAAEDVFQSNLGSSMLDSAAAAFRYDARLSDMYAWAVINIFDYQFSFGVDTVFRLLDVAMAWFMVYLVTAVMLARRPRLALKDGAAFAAAFLIIYLNRNCACLYVAFSNIHNYLIISLLTLLFLIPFGMKLCGARLPRGVPFRAAMLILGFLFGFSCNVTPAAFMVTLALICIGAAIKKRQINIKAALFSWEFAGLVGVLAACFVMYVVGRGISVYTDPGLYDNVNDYVPISMLFTDTKLALLKCFNHAAENFRIMLPGCIAMALMLLAELWRGGQGQGYGGAKLIGAGLLFVTLHTLAMTQIHPQWMVRLLLPAYLVSVACAGFGAFRLIDGLKPPRAAFNVAGLALALLLVLASVDMARFRIWYNGSVKKGLDEIKNSPNDWTYVSSAYFESGKSDIFGFTQYPFLEDWVLPQYIYGKYTDFSD